MKNTITKSFAFTILGLFLSLMSYSQSISGKVRAFETSTDLPYSNVDVYKNDTLKASLISDKFGNFSISLDTGVYRCEIYYVGFKSMTQEVRVSDDESINFSLKKDPKSKAKDVPKSRDKESEFEDVSSHYSHDLAPAEDAEMVVSRKMYDTYSTVGSHKSLSIPIAPGREVQNAEPGKLTAGEINDFSKWKLWNDIKENDLKSFQTTWKFVPRGRYTVQVTDNSGLPLADILVRLMDDDKSVYVARTDNTGKAELWNSLQYNDSNLTSRLELQVVYNGKLSRKKAVIFDEGINTFKMEAECNQSQQVDIAFVVDATGSMGDELDFLKEELNDVMYKSKQISSSLTFNFANVFYRDHGDQYLTRTQNFTRVLSESIAFISNQYAGGGGDYEEAVEVALDSAINGLSWSKYARTRIVFLVLDAPPHNNEEIQEKLKRLSAQAAEKGIRIVPLVASGINKPAEYLMRSIALATNGTYAFLTDHSGIGGKHLEPSTDDYKVELLNDLLVRIIKSYTYMPDCKQEIPDLDLGFNDSVVNYMPPKDTSQNADSSIENPDPIEIEWKYYPNPTRGIVNVKANVAIKELYITDLSGKVLQMIKDINPEVVVQADLSGYASGIYLIRYPVGKQWISGKVILIRD